MNQDFLMKVLVHMAMQKLEKGVMVDSTGEQKEEQMLLEPY
jgi:threonine synthase